jgi:hypothetical protein
MQKPTAPTFVLVTASWPSRKSTAPDRSCAARSTGSSVMSLPASSASCAVLPPNRSGASATNPSAASRSVTVGDVVGQAPPLLDDDDAGTGA